MCKIFLSLISFRRNWAKGMAKNWWSKGLFIPPTLPLCRCPEKQFCVHGWVSKGLRNRPLLCVIVHAIGIVLSSIFAR